MRVARVTLVCFLTSAVLANGQTNFRVQSIQQHSDGPVALTWPALAGRTYHVMSATTLDGWWMDSPRLTAGTNDSMLCYTDTFSAGVAQLFYKVRRDRAQFVMTLVLDRSGSMNGGGN